MPAVLPVSKGKITWAVPFEKTVPEQAVNSLLNVADVCGAKGYPRLYRPSGRTDMTRDFLANYFVEEGEAGDVLVFLDNDHLHPPDIVERLGAVALAGYPLVSALTFRRMTPTTDSAPDALLYAWDFDGRLKTVRSWVRGALVDCAYGGFGAVAIRWEVFETLKLQGNELPFFRYIYKPGKLQYPSEDVYFAHLTHSAGLPWACDTGCITPHLTWNIVDLETFDGFPWAEYDALPESQPR